MTSSVQATPRKASISTTNSTHRPVTARPRSLTHEAIALRAHSLYEESGYQNGRDVEFWLEAERQLREDLDV